MYVCCNGVKLVDDAYVDVNVSIEAIDAKDKIKEDFPHYNVSYCEVPKMEYGQEILCYWYAAK